MKNKILITAIRSYYQQKDAIERVRKLHKPMYGKYCITCENGWGDPEFYPCPTIKALDGDVDV